MLANKRIFLVLAPLVCSNICFATDMSSLIESLKPLAAETQQIESQKSDEQSQTSSNTTQFDELDSKRHFYQLYSKDEKALLADNKGLAQKMSQADVRLKAIAKQEHDLVVAYLQSANPAYGAEAKLLAKFQPLEDQGKKAIAELKDSRPYLFAAAAAAGINLSHSIASSMKFSSSRSSGSGKGAAGAAVADLIVQGLVQIQVTSALKGATGAVTDAAKFAEDMQSGSVNDPSVDTGLFSGSAEGLVDRGILYMMITGRSPLTSSSFHAFTAGAQLSDLNDADNQVENTLQAISPVYDSLNKELEGLKIAMNKTEASTLESALAEAGK